MEAQERPVGRGTRCGQAGHISYKAELNARGQPRNEQVILTGLLNPHPGTIRTCRAGMGKTLYSGH